jgi:hypothetical protein
MEHRGLIVKFKINKAKIYDLIVGLYIYMMPIMYVVFAVSAYRWADADWMTHFQQHWPFAPYWAAVLAVPLTVAWPFVLFVFLVGTLMRFFA